MNAALEAPLAVVAHDAGAANQLFAWLEHAVAAPPALCLAGPALTLWRQQFGEPAQTSLADALADARTVLSGTGWASSLEHEARRLARQLGARSIAVIDHWTNYRERFIRDGEEILPDEIWVGDEYAKQLAEATFPGTRVVQRPDAYLAAQVSQIGPIRTGGGARLLYVLEPIRQAWGELAVAGEFAALDFFIDNLACLELGEAVQIRLRPHPSDAPGKYASWMQRQGDSRIALDDAPTLAAALTWSNVVAGCQTYAMVVALHAGRRVISSIPPWAPQCVLPHREIMKLSVLSHGTVDAGNVTNGFN